MAKNRTNIAHSVAQRILAIHRARNFQAITARLDSIKSLSANVIYLMPIFPVGIVNSINSPYGPRDYLSVNAEFGTLADLRKLIDQAHARNLPVILDWVGNHTAWDHPGLNASTYLNAKEANEVVRYTTNHDVNSFDGTSQSLFGGQAGSMAAFAVVALMKGVPMIYSGQEVATLCQQTFPFTGKAIDWSLNLGVPAEYAKIISLRNGSYEMVRCHNSENYPYVRDMALKVYEYPVFSNGETLSLQRWLNSRKSDGLISWSMRREPGSVRMRGLRAD